MGKGYTKLPNEILETLCGSSFPSIQIRVILYVARKTFGWNKSSDVISISKMADELGCARETAVRAVIDLEKKGVLEGSQRQAGKAHSMKIRNPKYWGIPVTKKSHVTKKSQGCDEMVTGRCDQKVTGTCDEKVTHKRKKDTIKDTKQKKELSPVPDEETMFGGKITVREFEALSEAEQDAMYEAEGWR